MAIMPLDEPRPRLPPNRADWRAFTAMAFRPLYLGAALFGAVAILAWVHGFAGTSALPGLLWHGHEMIWGYAGAIIVGFLLTAVATWTGQKPLRGAPLAALAALWLGARIAAALETGTPVLTGLLSVGFLLASAAALAVPVVRTRNRRNLPIPFLLVGFAVANSVFLLAAAGRLAIDPARLLVAGLLVVAGFIAVIGLRVIPFFSHRALQHPQVAHPAWAGRAAILAPLVLAVIAASGQDTPLALVAGVAGMGFNLALLGRNLRVAGTGVLRHPLLWILYAGYVLTALGLGLAGWALAMAPAWLSAAVHLIAIGGIGVLTLGMMTRTALGHTGRPLALPAPMVPAYGLMLVAVVARLAAAWPGMTHAPALIEVAGACFAGALLLFVWRYGPWLWRTRADGLPG
ncbi:NnrS family protein [Nitrogeniibacter mangrovi]|uniref:NnrS family protein n=1 Tax=Nitrogeniibacter mangrovi TaxID=2016596 RepID=A0A6C1B891_9RHOO|nr:NnrS family protein [Nitrogeniibacter mangrovi]QID19593.1 NnrS family protein [Nitrogeniibacter mangrovi]